MTYSPFEVQEQLHLPDSTLRRLARQFSDYLSPQKTRKRRYSPRDVETLRTAREMLEQGSTVDQVKEHLSKIVDIQPDENELLSPTDREMLARMNEQYKTIAAELDRLKTDNQANKDRIADLERQIADLSRPPWWKKIFKGHP